MSELIIVKSSKQDKHYKTINLTALLDSNLSWKAKGILYYLLTRPKKWKLWTQDLISKSTDGETGIWTGIKELIDQKYLYREKMYRKGHKGILYWVTFVFTEPTPNFNVEKALKNLGNIDVENIDIKNQGHIKRLINSNNIKLYSLHIKFSKKLAEIVTSSKNIKINKTKIEVWSHEIRKLHTIEGISHKRISQVLDWYQDHYRGEYIPVVESGLSFRSKFTRLEDAMEREKSVRPKKTKDDYPKITVLLRDTLETITRVVLSERENEDLIEVSSKIHEFYKNDIHRDVKSGGIHYYSDFVKDYVYFLERFYEGFDRLSPKLIMPGAKIWNRFVKWEQEDRLNLNFRTGFACL